MEFMDMLRGRRSVRRFEAREVEDGIVEKLLEATLTAPSSKNSQSTRIAVTRGRKALEAVAGMRSRGSGFVADAPLVFFVMGDEAVSDLWRINAAISATVLQLAAESMGLGSCWVHVDGRPHDESAPDGPTAEDHLRAAIPDLPPYGVLCVVAVGWPEGEKPAKPHGNDVQKTFYV